MTIAFIHPHKAFLPELEAYSRFFATYGIDSNEYPTGSTLPAATDIAWHIMGMDLHRNRNIITIHEYASASTGQWKKWKDLGKRVFNARPAYRLYLNDYVHEKISFKDGVPYGFRDMGIDPSLLAQKNPARNIVYDFIYTGSCSPDRELDKLLNCFTQNDLRHRSILVLSRDYGALQQHFREYPNIIFKGPVPQDTVKDFIRQAAFAINYLPNREPYNRQTSTKLLEYAALKIPVISTQYSWLKNWQRDRGGDFFWLNSDLTNLNWEAVNAATYSSPDLSSITWDKQIRRSGVLEFLQSRVPDLDFRKPKESPLL